MASQLECRHIRNPNASALLAVGEFYRKIAKSEGLTDSKAKKGIDNRLADLRGWIARFSWSVMVLQDSDETVWGCAHCLPLTGTAYQTILSCQGNARDYLAADVILGDTAITSGEANYCYVGMCACDPSSKQEGYGYFAIPLFLAMQKLFYRIRLKGLLCQSHIEVEAENIRKQGCERKYGRGPFGIWYFDHHCAKRHPFTTLAATIHRIWEERAQLGFSKRQREVIRHAMTGKSNKEIAAVLENPSGEKLSPRTVEEYWEQIFEKCDRCQSAFEDEFGCKVDTHDRTAVIAFCSQHSAELSAPPDHTE
jgi:DNA-binding CsgD family transcriptional regulator